MTKPLPPAAPPRLYVKPRAALVRGDSSTVRDPVSKACLPAAGRYVPESSHWIRQIKAGDVLIVAPPVPPVVSPFQIPDSKPREE